MKMTFTGTSANGQDARFRTSNRGPLVARRSPAPEPATDWQSPIKGTAPRPPPSRPYPLEKARPGTIGLRGRAPLLAGHPALRRRSRFVRREPNEHRVRYSFLARQSALGTLSGIGDQ